jgi:hypothetical protein
LSYCSHDWFIWQTFVVVYTRHCDCALTTSVLPACYTVSIGNYRRFEATWYRLLPLKMKALPFLWNVGIYLPVFTAWHPRRLSIRVAYQLVKYKRLVRTQIQVSFWYINKRWWFNCLLSRLSTVRWKRTSNHYLYMLTVSTTWQVSASGRCLSVGPMSVVAPRLNDNSASQCSTHLWFINCKSISMCGGGGGVEVHI